MFRRLWSNLPEDPHFPSDLKGLGYFINDEDEIRSLNNPDNYFKFFLTKNPRHNDRQRYAMNEAVGKLVHQRLEDLGLRKVLLPLAATSASDPHVPIFVSANIASASRVVLVFGETCQELGVLAHRVIGGPGGVDQGSLVSVVRALQGQRASAADGSAPGVILANTGELLWSPAVRRALTQTGFDGVPMPSAVHAGMHYDDAQHRVPGHATARDHVRYVFETVVPAFCNVAARFDLIGVGDGVNAVVEHFDWAVTWGRLRAKINSFAIVGGFFSTSDLQCEGFQMFLREKARAWVLSPEPLNIALAGADGNPNAPSITNFGCPTFSGGTADFVECLLVRSHPAVLAWLQEVALDGPAYKNPVIDPQYEDAVPPGMAEPDWSQWQDTDAAQNPSDLGTVEPRADTGDENAEGGMIGKDKEKNADSEGGMIGKGKEKNADSEGGEEP